MTDSSSTLDDDPQDPGDAEFNDAGMREIYRQLNHADLPGDPPFDAEAGLRDLKDRMRAEGIAFREEAASLGEEGFAGSDPASQPANRPDSHGHP